jgi:hypothetical protein
LMANNAGRYGGGEGMLLVQGERIRGSILFGLWLFGDLGWDKGGGSICLRFMAWFAY